MFPKDEETAALGRQATVLKKAKDWDGTIACLRAQQERMITSPVSYPIDTWCRLALVLQQAGRFAESEIEFQKLLDDLPRKARKEALLDEPTRSFGKSTTKMSIYNQIIRIHSKLIRERWGLANTREMKKKKA